MNSTDLSVVVFCLVAGAFYFWQWGYHQGWNARNKRMEEEAAARQKAYWPV
jgi:hypothetical protein